MPPSSPLSPSFNLASLFSGQKLLITIAVVVILATVWLVYSRQNSSQNVEEITAQKVAEDAAKAENPFKSENPLGKVETNPFEKTKKVLNPFEQ